MKHHRVWLDGRRVLAATLMLQSAAAAAQTTDHEVASEAASGNAAERLRLAEDMAAIVQRRVKAARDPLAATRPGSLADHVVRLVGLMGYSMPVFWLGLIGLLLFYGILGWVGGPGRLDAAFDMMYEFEVTPVTGMILIDTALAGRWDMWVNAISHIILPAGLLGHIASGLRISEAMAGQLVTAYALGSFVAAIPLVTLTQGWWRRRALLLAIGGDFTYV